VMSVPRAVLVLLCVVLTVARARRSSPEPDDVQEKVNSARCTSRCLSLHMTQLTAAFRHIQNIQVLDWCENHRRCAQCLQPCKELWETRKAISPKSCEKQTECVTSREFLASLRSSRQGDCPPPQRATGFAAACVESCSLDHDCPSSRKCCFNGCGHTCQAPANLYKGVPLKPRREMSFVENPEGHVKVAWVSKFNVSMEPVIYMLQSRWNIGIHPSEDHASPWATVVMTLSEDVILSDLRPQRWYQFRVAAINSHGSRGFTTPSKHYISSKDPSPPEPPTNIRVSNQTLELTGSRPSVAVLLRWEPPREGDLPVHNYRITWMSRHARAVSAEFEGNLVLDAQTELWLQGLLPATPYVLSVQTVAYWGQKRLKSHRAQLFFTTIIHEASSHKPPESSRLAHMDMLPNPSENLRLEVAAPHFHHSQLQVKVFWKWSHHARQRHRGPYILSWHPHTCTTNVTSADRTTTVEGTHHTIKGLQFSCKYRVSVAMVADPGAEAVAWVTTPTCSSIRVRGDKALPCNKQAERPLAGRKVVLRPERLTADFQQVNGSLLTTLQWRMSHHAMDSAAVEGFQFTWSLQSELSPATGMHEDALISQTQTIAPQSERFITIDGLQADSMYRVQLQVLTAGGRTGAAVSKTIHTPTINATL
uniref:Anosmin 1b n=1 Tax=Poecilia formosa TaxID=48698 RepID=A0A096M507_POEFO